MPFSLTEMSDTKTTENEQNDSDGSNDRQTPDDIWMVRPCELYLDEYNECSSYRGKFHEKFIYGEPRTARCAQWLADYQNCMNFRKTRHMMYSEAIIDSEKSRRKERMDSAQANDVWTYRTTPPEDWNSPLPEHLEKNKIPDLTKMHEKETNCVIL